MKILIFEPWIVGYYYVHDLILSDEVNDYIYVHCDSAQTGQVLADLNNWKKNWHTGFECKIQDFKDFKYDYSYMLKTVAPDRILLLSLHSIEQRSVSYIGEILGVKSVFIQHGIFTDDIGTYNKTILAYIGNLRNTLARVMYFLKMQLYLKRSLRSISERWSNLDFIASTNELIFRHVKYKWSPNKVNKRFLKLHRGYVTDASAVDLFERMGFSREIFQVSGPIDCFKVNKVLKRLKDSDLQRRVYYISSPDVLEHKRDFFDKLEEFICELKSSNIGFIYRRHPGEPEVNNEYLNSIEDLEVDRSQGLEAMINSSVVLGINSSLLYTASLVKSSTLLLDIDGMPIQNQILAEIDKGKRYSIDERQELLARIIAINKQESFFHLELKCDDPFTRMLNDMYE